jgi:hypothetical protein
LDDTDAGMNAEEPARTPALPENEDDDEDEDDFDHIFIVYRWTRRRRLWRGRQKVSVAGQNPKKCNGVMDFWITGLILSDVRISCLHCYRRDRPGHIGDKGRNIGIFHYFLGRAADGDPSLCYHAASPPASDSGAASEEDYYSCLHPI